MCFQERCLDCASQKYLRKRIRTRQTYLQALFHDQRDCEVDGYTRNTTSFIQHSGLQIFLADICVPVNHSGLDINLLKETAHEAKPNASGPGRWD